MTCLCLATLLGACGGKTSGDVSGDAGGSGGGGGDNDAGSAECAASGGTGASSFGVSTGGDAGVPACSQLMLSAYANFQEWEHGFGFDGCAPEPGLYVVKSVDFDRVTLVGTPAEFRARTVLPDWFSEGEVVFAGARAHGSIPDGWDYIISDHYTALVGRSVPADIPDGPHIEAEPQCTNVGCTPCGEPPRPETIYAIQAIDPDSTNYINWGAGVGTEHWVVGNLHVVQFQKYCSPECGEPVGPAARVIAVGPYNVGE